MLSATLIEFALDHEGAIWASTTRGLLRFANSHWEKIGADWGFSAEQARYLFVDKQGELWVNGATDLYCRSPGAHVFQMRKLPYHWLVRQTPDGVLWFSEVGRGIRAVSGPLAEFYDGSKAALRLPAGAVQTDGAFWMSAVEPSGVFRISKPEQPPGSVVDLSSGLAEKFTHQDGLTSDTTGWKGTTSDVVG